jgi:ATP-binding cassette subfamily B protein RaxB
MEIAGQMNMASRALRLNLEHIDQLQTPCILHWEMKHFVVLRAIHKDFIVIHDPASGERKVAMTEVDTCFTGVALELSPSPSFEKKKDVHPLTIQHFWSRISGLKRTLFIILGLSLLLQLFAIVSPFYMQTVIDDVILRNDNHLLTVLAIGFGLLLLIEVGTSAIRRFAILHLSSRLSIQMSSNVFHHLIRLPLEYFNKRHMGDVVSRFSSLATIRELLTTGIVAVVIDGLMAFITLFVMFLYDVKLTLIVVGIVGLYALIRYVFYRPIRHLNEEFIVRSAKENSHFMESVRAAQTIKLFEQENQRQNQWLNKLADAINKNIQLTRWDIGFNSINQLLFGLENILIIFFAASAVMNNVFSIGMLFAFVSYKTRFLSAMDGLIAKWIEFKMLELHFARLADIVFTERDTQSAIIHRCGEISGNATLKGKIVLKNGTYRYSKLEQPIFSNINLSIEPGQTVAIVGESGSGKTSLMKCLMGLLPLEEGKIFIDEKPLAKTLDYRSQIAAVMQEDQLLSGSIAENIACFADSIDIKKVIWAAQMACVHEDVCAMSMQYNTLVGDMGTSLSGGQKQRIILARALYRQPSILFMDEATSHLDTGNEAKVCANLDAIKITRVIVAHRLQTIARADRIYKLVDGQLQQIAKANLINDQNQTSTEEEPGDTL